MGTLSTETASVVALVAAATAVLALVVTVLFAARQRVVLRRMRVLMGDTSVDAGAVLARQQQALATDRARTEELEQQIARLRGRLAQHLQHVAVVRYDAFGDMGGRMSFSAAIVDDAGDGMVLSSIHARGESRTYAKGVVAGRSDITLTPEERQALDAARSGAADE